MRFLLSLLFVASITATVSAADPSPAELLEWDARFLDVEQPTMPNLPGVGQGWGLRLVNVHYTAPEGKLPARYDLVFNFTREIPDTYMSEFAAQFPLAPSTCSSIIFYALDNFDIPFARLPFYLSEGELTGKPGDSFKVTVLVDKATLDKTVEKRVIVPAQGDRPAIYATGRIRVRPVIGVPNVGEYRGSLIIRVRS